MIVTGGAGFIGSNFVRLALAETGERVVVLDKLTYAGHRESLEAVAGHPRFRFVEGDIADRDAVRDLMREEEPTAILNFAAESHVDRSIDSPGDFVQTNVVGTFELLEAARLHRERLAAGEQDAFRFLHVSTDEVYGSLGAEGKFTEDSPLRPTSPYAASKAAADLLVQAYVRTHGLDAVITRCSNNFGPCQFPEKMIPLFVTHALDDQPLPLYGDGLNVRDWIHVEDHCAALDVLLREGRAGRIYNVGAGNEWTNRDLTREILRRMGKPESLIRPVADRPAHDRRYALDASRLQAETSWRPVHAFGEGLDETIGWYREHREWWEAVRSGEYRRFHEAWYGKRLEGRGP
jgi:dTDP-glucose 4,6-dehydratase